jgi:hypothetical protein
MLFIMHHDVYNFVYGIVLCWITSGANQHYDLVLHGTYHKVPNMKPKKLKTGDPHFVGSFIPFIFFSI